MHPALESVLLLAMTGISAYLMISYSPATRSGAAIPGALFLAALLLYAAHLWWLPQLLAPALAVWAVGLGAFALFRYRSAASPSK